MQLTAEKYQVQLMANSARMRDVTRMTQLMEAQGRFQEGLKLRKDAIQQHKDHWDQALQMRKDQIYGSAEDAHQAADQILNLAVPMPSTGLQGRYPYLRAAAKEVLNRNPSYQAGDYDAAKNLRRMVATADVRAMSSALTQSEQMQSGLRQFEPLARQAGRTMLALIGRTDPTGTNTFNRWVNAGRRTSGDPDVAQFDAAMRQ